MPMACSASKLSDAAPCHQLRSVGVVERDLWRKTNARSILQRFEIFAWDLQRGPGLAFLRSRLRMRGVCHAMPRHAAMLRGVCDTFLAFSQILRGQCFTAGATHL